MFASSQRLTPSSDQSSHSTPTLVSLIANTHTTTTPKKNAILRKLKPSIISSGLGMLSRSPEPLSTSTLLRRSGMAESERSWLMMCFSWIRMSRKAIIRLMSGLGCRRRVQAILRAIGMRKSTRQGWQESWRCLRKGLLTIRRVLVDGPVEFRAVFVLGAFLS